MIWNIISIKIILKNEQIPEQHGDLKWQKSGVHSFLNLFQYKWAKICIVR